MRKFMIGLLLLVMAACRSLLQETVDAYAVSQSESNAIVSIWEEQLVPSANNPNPPVTDIDALAVTYFDHIHKLAVARDTIQIYLDSAKGDPDAAFGFNTGTQLLMYIDANIQQVLKSWEQWLDPNSDKEQFIVDVNNMIADFKVLDRKFDEWIKQFKVEGNK